MMVIFRVSVNLKTAIHCIAMLNVCLRRKMEWPQIQLTMHSSSFARLSLLLNNLDNQHPLLCQWLHWRHLFCHSKMIITTTSTKKKNIWVFHKFKQNSTLIKCNRNVCQQYTLQTCMSICSQNPILSVVCFMQQVSSVLGSVHSLVRKQVKWRPQFMKINLSRWSTPWSGLIT